MEQQWNKIFLIQDNSGSTILERKYVHQAVYVKMRLSIIYPVNILFFLFRNVIRDGIPYLQVSLKGFSLAVTAALKKSQMQQAVINNCTLPFDDSEHSQNITEEIHT